MGRRLSATFLGDGSCVTDKKKHKAILLVGAAGSGKTSLVNRIVNATFDVHWSSPYRFQLDHAGGQTDIIKVYNINHYEGFKFDCSLTISSGRLKRGRITWSLICNYFFTVHFIVLFRKYRVIQFNLAEIIKFSDFPLFRYGPRTMNCRLYGPRFNVSFRLTQAKRKKNI